MERKNMFVAEPVSTGGGRLGVLKIGHREWTNQTSELKTPHVFPVINVIGGPPGPDRNGGIWRPIKWWMFLHPPRTQAYLCQVLHAVDFNLDRESWAEWKSKRFGEWITDWQEKSEYKVPESAHGRPDAGYPFREWMKHWDHWQSKPGSMPSVVPITFLDSGGFALMKLADLQKAKDILNIKESPSSILELQRKLGGDLIASLDYPLPPGLSDSDIRKRQNRSIHRAIQMLKELAKCQDSYRPIPYVAVHGTNRENATRYVDKFFRLWNRKLSDEQERAIAFGIAIGSMVPRSDDPRTVVEVVSGITEALKRNLKRYGLTFDPPVHVFGINSHLAGLLAYLGVDTFDSTTFADVAQRANYLGKDLRPIHVRDLTYEVLDDCDCFVCAGLRRARETDPLGHFKEILVKNHKASPEEGATQASPSLPKGKGRYYHHFPLPGFPHGLATKSDLYGLLAIHNWHQLQAEIRDVRTAISNHSLAQYLLNMVQKQGGQRQNRLLDALLYIAKVEMDTATRTGRLYSLMSPEMRAQVDNLDVSTRTNARATEKRKLWKREEFDLEDSDNPYRGPTSQKKVLLILACSKTKPYADSTHHKQVLRTLQKAFPNHYHQIHKVTLSGLYGPVPAEREGWDAVLGYDFKLEEGNTDQANFITERLKTYLETYKYDDVLVFIYFPAYRHVAEKALKVANLPAATRTQLIPDHPHRGGKPATYRDELLRCLADIFKVKLPENMLRGAAVAKPQQLTLFDKETPTV